MKKTLSYALLLCAASSPAQQQVKVNDEPVFGPVRSFTITDYHTVKKNGEWIKQEVRSPAWDPDYACVLDTYGHLIERKEFDENGRVIDSGENEYDAKGNIIRAIRHAQNKPADTINYSYMYDEKGNIHQMFQQRVGGTRLTFTYKYNEAGKMLERYVQREGDSLPYLQVKNSYDAKGNLIETAEFNRNKEPGWRYVYVRDEKGNPVEETWYRQGNKFFIKYFWGYDDKGNRTRCDWVNKKGKIYASWTMQYEYDSNGNWTRCLELNTKRVFPLMKRDNIITERKIGYF